MTATNFLLVLLILIILEVFVAEGTGCFMLFSLLLLVALLPVIWAVNSLLGL